MPFSLHPSATIHDILLQATTFLKNSGVEDSGLAVEWIICHELACARLELALRHNDRLSPEASRSVQEHVNRMAAGEPLQYVLGEAEFMGRLFHVDRRGLIPRPETELLAELVLDRADLWALPRPNIAEVGTGSGCIIISLASAQPHGSYQANDIAPDILDLARKNAVRHGVQNCIRFYMDNLLSAVPPDSLDVVISNPPYVQTDAWAQLPAMIREHEPRAALDGGPDGLSVIRPLITQAVQVLKPGGRLFLEIGADQGAAIQHLLTKNGFADGEIRTDLAGKDRLVTARRQRYV